MLKSMPEVEASPEQGQDRQMRILFLDDNEVDRKRLRRLCATAGLNSVATEVGSIDEMKRALAAQSFDLVFIDHILTAEDGLDAVDILMADPMQSAMTIMIAGEGRIDTAVEAMRRGCSDYLTKSNLSVEALQKSVATALERRMMSLSLEEERGKRRALENAVRQYASECSAEMRSILAGTLRRVRKLRSIAKSSELVEAFGDLETNINRLWGVLPQFGENVDLSLQNAAHSKLVEKG